jgi:hypothetical protein
MTNKKPNWLTEEPDRVSVKLSRPIKLSGVSVNTITLRSPTIRDVRGAKKLSKDDKEYQEIILFASLSGVGPEEIETLSLKDYGRLQEGYFRLVSDDTDTSGDPEPLPKTGD